MLLQIVTILLPVAATSGWFMGQKELRRRRKKHTFKLRQDYFRGLNYIIDEQPDKAVDVFIKLLEVDSETVETHLALGSLFRRRGEVDRAIRIHQNLIARPQLSQDQKLEALTCLGKDYLSAGVLDRAERVFLELVKFGHETKSVLQSLIRIYQQEKDWSKAIQIARKVETVVGVPMANEISHFYCEIAVKKVIEKQWDEALGYLKQAFSVNRFSVRAYILRADIFYKQGHWYKAVENYKRVLELDRSLLVIILPRLFDCYSIENKHQIFLEFVQREVKDHYYLAELVSGSLRDFLLTSKLIDDVLLQQFESNLSISGLEFLVSYYLQHAPAQEAENLSRIRQFLSILMEDSPKYQCKNCGFMTNSLLWVCPSCHRWSTVRSLLEPQEV